MELAEYQSWIEKVIADGVPRRERRAITQMSQEDITFLQDYEIDVADGIIQLEDRIIVGAKARRHQHKGNSLSLQEWRELPIFLSQSQAVLFDHQNKTLLYLMPATDGRMIKVVVEANRLMRGKLRQESVRTIFKVSRLSIAAGLKGKQYTLIRGIL